MRAGARSAQEHDDARLHAMGRGTLQQRLHTEQSCPLRRKLQHDGRAAAHSNRAAAVGTRDGRKGSRPLSRSAAALRNQPAGQHPANLRAGRPLPGGNRHSRTARGIRQAATTLEHARAWHRKSHRSGFHRPAKDAAARSDPELFGHERSSRRLSLERLLRLPRDLRQRSLAGPLGALCPVRQPRILVQSRSNDPQGTSRAIRSATSSPTAAPSPQASAWFATSIRARQC